MEKKFLMMVVLLLTSCSSVPMEPEPLPAALEDGIEKKEERVTMTLKSCPVGIAISELLSGRGFSYIVPDNMPDVKVQADFVDLAFEDALFNVCSQAGLFFYRIGNLYVVRTTENSNYLLLLRETKAEDVGKLFGVAVEKDSTVASMPGYICIKDTYINLQRLFAQYENYFRDCKRRYYLEVWLVQSSLDSSLQLEANLRFKGFDLFSGVTSINDILSCYLDATGERIDASIVDYQSIYLSENNKGSFKIGTTLVRETKQVSPEGYASTNGFQSFSDGIELNSLVSLVERNLYALNVDLKSSRYRSNSSAQDVVPPNDVTEVTNNRLNVKNNKVYLLAQLNRRANSKSFGLISAGASSQQMVINVFVRVRLID